LVVIGAGGPLRELIDGLQNHEHLTGVAVYDVNGTPLASTPGLRWPVRTAPAAVTKAVEEGTARGQFFRLAGQPTHVFPLSLRSRTGVIGAIAIFHNVGYISTHRIGIWLRALVSIGTQALLIVSITLLIIHLSLGKPLGRMAQWLRDQRAGGGPGSTPPQQ